MDGYLLGLNFPTHWRVTFGSNLCPLREVKASRGKVISDKDLEILLDRSDLKGEETDHQQVSVALPELLWGNTDLTIILLI